MNSIPKSFPPYQSPFVSFNQPIHINSNVSIPPLNQTNQSNHSNVSIPPLNQTIQTIHSATNNEIPIDQPMNQSISDTINPENSSDWIIVGIVTTVLLLVIVGIGVYYLLKHDPHTESVTARIIKLDCTVHMDKNKCSATITYTYNGNNYTPQKAVVLPITTKEGDNITVLVDPNEPDHFSISIISKRHLGLIFLISGVVSIIAIWGILLSILLNR